MKVLSVLILCTLVPLSHYAAAQLLNGSNLPRVRIDDTSQRLQRQLNTRVERDLALQDSIDAANALDTIDTLASDAINAVSQLPAQLPIADKLGKTALVEVLTENGWRALQREWLLYVSDNHLPAVKKLGLRIISNKSLTALNISMLRVQVPESMDTRQTLTQALSSIDSGIVVERNYVYSSQSKHLGDGNTDVAGKISQATPLYQGEGRIGIIDTAIDNSHPALKTNPPQQRNFVDEGVPTPRAHGTAVAGRLLGEYGYAPHAAVLSASVFYKRNNYQEGAATHSLVQALDWLMSEKVAVINMSLAGPPNAFLELSLKKALAKGAIIVAAVGNEGPAAPPLYPAAYPSVIAVTAVDNNNKIYRWAVQGDHVEVAAHGVGVRTARIGADYGYESGTSMAAPLITAYLARIHYDQGLDHAQARQYLSKKVIDKGDKGRDRVFGLGVLAREPSSEQ